LLAFPVFFETRVSAGDAGRRATRWDGSVRSGSRCPESVILKRYLSALCGLCA